MIIVRMMVLRQWSTGVSGRNDYGYVIYLEPEDIDRALSVLQV